jgi:hypothetical protein
MRTAWGVFKAARMTGLDDRGDFYRFWYHAVDLGPDEEALESWKAMRVPGSTAEQFFVVGGNLILTTRRLVFEPYRNHRAAFGQHGSKQMVNLLAAFSDRVAPRAPISISLDELLAEARHDRKVAVRVGDRDGTKAEFFFGATTITRGDMARRDAVLASILEHRTRSRQPGT